VEKARGRGRTVVVLGLLLPGILSVCPRAGALDPALDVSQYAHTAWRIREGFTKGPITAIAQTPDGYLWLGTEFGLVRFDGVRAVPWEAPAGQQLPSTFIRSLLAASDGTLWIGTLKGLASWKDGRLVQHPILADQSVDALLESDEGTIWLGALNGSSTGRLCAIEGGRIQCYGEDGSLGRWVEFLFEDREKNLWAATEAGLWRWEPGAPRLYLMPSPISGGRQSLMEDDRGTLLVSTASGIKQFVNGNIQAYSLPGIERKLKQGKLFRDRGGGLWISVTGTGLAHVHQGRTDVFALSDGLSGDQVWVLFEDREGDIWVATNGGLDRFREYAVDTFSAKKGLSQAIAGSVLADKDGSVWLTTSEGLNRWKNGQTTVYGKQDRKLNGRSPHCLFQDHHGRIWVGTLDGLGYLESNRFIPVPGIPGGPMRGMAGDTDGNLWIASLNAGLFRLGARGEVEQIPWIKVGHKDFATALAVDPLQGGLWIGFYNGGVVYSVDGRVRAAYTAADGLGDGYVGRFRFDADGTVWAATAGGLSRLKNGHVATLNSKNGLPCNAVHWVIQDNDHSFWLYMACGLVRITRPGVDAWAAAVDKDKDTKLTIQATVFDVSDGVRSEAIPSGYWPRVTRSADGKLWFGQFDGVRVIDPRHLPFNTLPPPVYVEQITADRKTYDASSAANGRVSLPAFIRDLKIDYTALSLVAPEKVLFRYKLEGRDRDWQEAGNRRQAFYTDLPPRNYRFRVVACNNSGVWNETGASLDFSVAPAYYQATWFRLSCVAAFLALLWGLYQLRLRQLAREFNAGLEARVGERIRIARELHDTLLQSFHGLLLRFQTVSNLLPAGEPKQKLDDAIDQAAQAITEGRDAVQGLRSSTTVTNDLACAITTLGQELAVGESNPNAAEFHVEVEGTTRDLHPILRDEVYRIAGEAVRNAFKHAQARRIEVEIRYDERRFRLRVRDDGKGIDPKLMNEDGRHGHYGLRGMRERAKLLGGKLAVWSELDSGTELELRIPASRAYETSPARRRSWLAEKLSGKDTETKS